MAIVNSEFQSSIMMNDECGRHDQICAEAIAKGTTAINEFFYNQSLDQSKAFREMDIWLKTFEETPFDLDKKTANSNQQDAEI